MAFAHGDERLIRMNYLGRRTPILPSYLGRRTPIRLCSEDL
ncbi:MAG: hypothetical protein RBR69_01080 [Candidatus Cloacimonadaceae bacterium]|nr:hypothetical protein [Candidatus Cloacimonadaceae bacterium]